MFRDVRGVDVSVSTPHLLTALAEEAVSVGALIRKTSFGQGRKRLSEATLAHESPTAGRMIGRLDLPREVMIVTVVRDGRVTYPGGDLVLPVGTRYQ
jgi:trk system potassium uptake protein TrkA